MTNLSPAAQAVLTAATQKLYCLDPEDVPMSASEYGSVIAAALRAAVGQAVPMDKELRETYLAGYYAGVNRQGFDCQIAGLRAVLAKWGKAPLLNIADELEGVGNE